MSRMSRFGWAICLFLMGISSVYAATDDTDPQAVVVLLFMFVGLTICCATMHWLSRHDDIVPYTVAVFIIGILFSMLSNVEGLSSFKESLDLWLDIDANLLLYTFLPVLIFGEAMSLNWHHAQGAFAQSTLLAGPGVVMGAMIMAALTHVAIPEWSWNLCFTFGAILSATDPVAVVSLLKNAGAAPKLTILIVGESLMNDGTAMVLFTMFFNMLQGKVYLWYEVILFFLQAVIGSPLTGFIGGFLCLIWMRNAHHAMKEIDVTIQIIVTICTAYLVFFVAQYSFEISGVLACCGAGICLAWLAPAIILSHETMHNVWGFLEWMGNTLIFLIAGLIMGHRTFQHVQLQDWFMMIFFYFALFVIRVIVIATLFPWVSTIGHRCSVKDAVFMAWAGLRGALAIALGLIVENSPHTGVDTAQSSRFLFYIGGIAALSIVINGTFAQAVLLHLGLIGNESSERGLVMNAIRKRLRNKMDSYINDVSKEQVLSEEEKVELRESCSIFNMGDAEQIHAMVGGELGGDGLPLRIPPVIAQDATGEEVGLSPEGADDLNRPLNTGRTVSNSSGRSTGSMTGNIISAAMGMHGNHLSLNQETYRILSVSHRGPQAELLPDLLAYVRTVFLELCRVKYWQMIETGKIPRTSHSAKFLLYSVDVGIDDVRDVHNGLRDWNVIEAHLEKVELYIRVLSAFINMLPRHYRLPRLTKLLAFLLSRREKRSVYILTSFIEAHEHAQGKIESFLGSDAEARGASFSSSAHGLSGANATAAAMAVESNGVEPVRSHRATPEETKVIAESKMLVERAKAVLDLFNSITVGAIRAKQRQHMLLAKEVHLVKAMVEEGLLSAKHADTFIEEIIRDSRRIDREREQLAKAQVARTQEALRTAGPQHSKDSTDSVDNMDFAIRPSMTSVGASMHSMYMQDKDFTPERSTLTEKFV